MHVTNILDCDADSQLVLDSTIGSPHLAYMTTAVAYVGRVSDVQPHPDNDELNTKMDIVTIAGKTNVATRPLPNRPRYRVGDFAVLLTENMILPEWLLKKLGLWNVEKNQGMLGGKGKNRLRPRAIGLTNKIMSEVALYPCKWRPYADRFIQSKRRQTGTIILTDWDGKNWPKDEAEHIPHRVIMAIGEHALWPDGVDVAWNLGIEEIADS